MYEVQYVLYLLAHGNFLANFGKTLLTEFPTLVKQTVRIMDVVDKFGRKSAPSQTYEIQTAVGHRLARRHGIGRYILPRAGAAAYHDVAADAAKLMYQYVGADNGKIVHNDFSGNLRRITDDAPVAYANVMRHVHSFHQQVVAAHDGTAFCRCPAIDGNVLANGIVIPYLGRGFLTAELQVLRHGANHRAGKENIALADARPVKHGDTVHQDIVGTYHDILVYVTERANLATVADDGFRVNVR